jgi:hypothetical protein
MHWTEPLLVQCPQRTNCPVPLAVVGPSHRCRIPPQLVQVIRPLPPQVLQGLEAGPWGEVCPGAAGGMGGGGPPPLNPRSPITQAADCANLSEQNVTRKMKPISWENIQPGYLKK